MLVNKVKNLYRVLLPIKFRSLVRKILKVFLYNYRYIRLKSSLFFLKEVQLILGAALTSEKNWFSTNEEWFDISNSNDWKNLFRNKKKLKRAVAEHVFEHLTQEQMKEAITLIYKHLVQNGTLRIAVPDGNHPDPEYRRHTGIRGIGADASDHKQFITFEYLKKELEDSGFKCYLREGYNSDGNLFSNDFPLELGKIMRTRFNVLNNSNKYGWDFKDSHTSLIVDAYKKNL